MKSIRLSFATMTIAFVICQITHADNSLKIHYSFEGGHDGAKTIAGRVGQAIELDGSSAIAIDEFGGVTGSNPRTIAAWMKTTQSKSGILSWGRPKNKGERWTIRINGQPKSPGQGALRAEVEGGFIIGTTNIRDGHWHHVAVVLPSGKSDIQDVKLYVDGKIEIISASANRTINTTGKHFRIGVDHREEYLRGGIDELRVYSRALSDDEVSKLASVDVHAPTTKPAPTRQPAKPATRPDPKAVDQTPQTGKFEMSFTEHSPLATAGAVQERALAPGQRRQVPANGYAYDVRKEKWAMYVPKDYDHKSPYGLMCFINSMPPTGLQKDWPPVLSKNRMIFACALDAGNKKDVHLRRIPMAIESVHNLKKIYNIDDDRIYISGSSGGGKAASLAAAAYPDLFDGGLFMVGAFPFDQYNQNRSRKLYDHARRNNRYVLYTATNDFNRSYVKSAANVFRSQGFRYVTYHEAPGKHGKANAEWFEKGIQAMDAPLRKAAFQVFRSAAQLEQRRSLGRAMVEYRKAMTHGGQEEFVDEARSRLEKLEAQYIKSFDEISVLINEGQLKQAVVSLAKFRKEYGESARVDANSLADAIRKKRTQK